MNKQELASKIWAMANELRGKVSASDYKDYMLGLIFYKYLSEREERYLTEELYFEREDFEKLTEEYIQVADNCKDNIGFFIENKNLFSRWLDNGVDFHISDIRTALSAFNRNIGHNYKKIYEKVFTLLETGLNSLGTSDGERTKAIRKLLNIIRLIPVDGSQDYDVLGFVYEFLLKNFAANAGKAGEFYTPFEASTVMSEIIADHLKGRDEISIYDPTSGSGSLLINIGKSLSKHMSTPNGIKYYAQELIENTYNLTRMNLMMHGVLPNNIVVRNGDTLSDDWPFFEEDNKEKTYDPVFVDGCCSNPPYSQAWNNDNADIDVRFADYGVAPKSKADLAFLLHNLYHLKPDGIMTIVMPHGVLFRGAEEAKIRRNLVEKGHIETIIGLPPNMFFGTGIPTIIIVLKKNRKNNDILFIDASKEFAKDGNKNKLRSRDVRKIVDTTINRESIEGFSRIVSKSEIEENDYNLNIPRYVDNTEEKETWDIYSTMFGGIPEKEVDSFNEFWDLFPSLKEELFEKTDIPYTSVKVEDIRETVLNNKQVKNFFEKYKQVLADFPDYIKKRLIDDYSSVVVKKEEMEIAEELKNRLRDIPLIDYYSAYQILDDNWSDISLDLELLQTEGFDSVKKVDPNKVLKKNSKTKELYELEEGLKGRIIPFLLVQSIYFSSEKDRIDSLTSELDGQNSEKEELLNSIDPNDKEELINDDGNIVAKKLNAAIKKIKAEIKKGAEYEEDSYEDSILKIAKTDDNIKSIKKEIKSLSEHIEKVTGEKIESLTDDEAKELLRAKWIEPVYKGILSLSTEIVNSYIKKIEYLNNKYAATYHDVSKETIETENEIATLLDDLTGDDFDMKGVAEFRKLLGGKYR